jgi:hypothetical protein
MGISVAWLTAARGSVGGASNKTDAGVDQSSGGGSAGAGGGAGALLWASGAVAALVIGCILLLSPYFNWAAESISIASMLAIADGRPYVSAPGEVPVNLSAFSPYLYWLLTPILRLFAMHDLRAVATLGRLTILLFFAGIPLMMARLTRVHFAALAVDRLMLVLATVTFVIMFPGFVPAIRPDFMSFLAEIVAFALFFDYEFRGRAARHLIASAALAGFACAAKANTVDVAGAVVLFLLLERRVLHAAAYAAITAAVFAAGMALSYAVLGERFVSAVVFSSLRNSLTGVALVRALLGAVQEVGLQSLGWWVLAAIGLAAMWREDRRKALLFVLGIGVSLVVGTAGQVKIGGAINYCFGAFFLSLLPVALGLQLILAGPPATPAGAPAWIGARVAFGALLAINVVTALTIPVATFVNDRRHYPYGAVTAHLAATHPDGHVYANDPNAVLHFAARSPLSPWAELLMENTPRLAPYLAGLRDELRDRPFAAAVIVGNDCAAWKPAGLFAGELAGMALEQRFDKLCVFARPR